MKLATVLLCLAVVVVAFAQTQDDKKPPGCGLVRGALYDALYLKPGMTRADIERNFITDGGAMRMTDGRYLYRRCHYIKIDVTFTLVRPKTISPEDTIVSVSKPYLEQPIAD